MTSAEIVKALRCTASVQPGDEPCANCPFNRTETLTEELKAHLHCEGWQNCDVDGVALAAADLIERLEKEKAALLEYVEKSAKCEQCANNRPQCDAIDCFLCVGDCPCQKCKHGSKWEWKGLGGEG